MPPKNKSSSPSVSLSSFLTSSSSPKIQRSPTPVSKSLFQQMHDEWQHDPHPVLLTKFMREGIKSDIQPQPSKPVPKQPLPRSANATYAATHREKMKRGLTSTNPAEREKGLAFIQKRKESYQKTQSKRTKKN